ncbi:MAG: GNAT family protein [Chloroflexota bacterium]
MTEGGAIEEMPVENVLAALPSLSSKRLLLRKLRRQDLDDLHALTSDPRVTDTLSWETHRSVESSRLYLEGLIERYDRAELAPWGVEHRADGCLIGTCGFITWYRHDTRAEVAYALAWPYWGQGLATEALRATIDFGFARMGLNRIEARCLVENAASARVMEKAGMHLEGVMREHIFLKGRYRDLKLYAVLRREHEAARLHVGTP